MRVNSKNWIVWVAVVATAWFAAVTMLWAVRSLTDHVPSTYVHVFAAGATVVPGARDPAPSVNVTCGSPASAAVLGDGGLPPLDVSRDQQLSRPPCDSLHSQSRYLWFGNLAIYALILIGLVAVGLRRHANAAATVAVGSAGHGVAQARRPL